MLPRERIQSKIDGRIVNTCTSPMVLRDMFYT